MEAIAEVAQQPRFVILASALLVMVSLLSLIYFYRANRARKARDRAVAAESSVRQQFEAVLSASRDGVVITNYAGDVLTLSEAAASILGVDRHTSIGRPVSRLPVRAVGEDMHAADLAVAFAPTPPGRLPGITLGLPGRRGTDDLRWVSVQAREVVVPGAEPAVVATIVDATGLPEAQEALTRSDAQFRKAMENAPVGMAMVDLDWRLMEVNRAFAEMMGSSVPALRGTPFAALSHPQDVGAERDQIQRLFDGHQSHFSLEKRFVKADGNVLWAVLDVAMVRHPGGAPDHFVTQLRDSTDARMHSELMAHRAMHDPLTGLANRTLLQEVLQQVLDQPDADGRVGVVAIDLDGFKELNDRFGHATGDSALIFVAGVLRAAAGSRGTVARLGGDEFVIVVQDPSGARAVEEVAEAIHEGLETPFVVKQHQITMRASVGIAMADADAVQTPLSAGAQAGAQRLLSAADAAMYRAKVGGKGRTEVFVPSMRSDSSSNAQLLAELRDAVDHGGLTLVFQPILDLADRKVVGFEALVRWRHPTRGTLLPGAFLPLVDDHRLSTDIATIVVDQAAQFLARPETRDAWVSINVGAEQLGDSEFADRVLTSIARHHLPAHRFIVELTEASLVSPNTRIRHELTELRNAGVPILLDDFGTGVSPLSYLRDLPVSGLKLDRSFTAGIPEDPAGVRVSRALGALARELGLGSATIAEGIETESQAEYLLESGWRFGQGWLFGVAQPADEVLALDLPYSDQPIDPRPMEDGAPLL